MDGLHAGRVVLGRGLDELRNAFVAVGQGPVLRQKVGVAWRRHALVGRGDPAPGALDARPSADTVILRGLLIRQPALPVVARVPARRRRHAPNVVGGIAQRHTACGLEADVALVVRSHHALHGRVVVRQPRKELIHALGLVGLEARQHGLVVIVQRAPAQRDHIFAQVQHLGVRLLNVAQHGAMARAAQLQQQVGLALDADGFVAHGELGPSVGRAVLRGIGGVDLLQIQVLHIGAGVGEAPGDLVGTAQHHKGQARQGGAYGINGAQGCAVRRLARRGLQARKVPDGGGRQAQVRVVGQQRLAAHGAGARNHPVVATLALVGACVAGQFVGPGQHASADLPGQRTFAVGWRHSSRCSTGGRCTINPQLAIQRRQVCGRSGRLPRIGWHQLPQPVGVQRARHRQTCELGAPIATQVQRHHQRPAHAVLGLPHRACGASGLHAQHQKLRWQGLGTFLVEGMDALAVGLQGLLGIQRQPSVLPPGHTHDVQAAHELVGLDRGRAKNLGQLAVHDPAVEFQLPGAFLRMYIAHCKPGILRGLSLDVGDIGAIAPHLYCFAEPRHSQGTIELCKAALHIHRRARACQQRHCHQPEGCPLHPCHVSCLLPLVLLLMLCTQSHGGSAPALRPHCNAEGAASSARVSSSAHCRPPHESS